jgi:hypothetical protein
MEIDYHAISHLDTKPSEDVSQLVHYTIIVLNNGQAIYVDPSWTIYMLPSGNLMIEI